MKLLLETAQRLAQRDMVQALVVLLVVLLFALGVSWPASARPNISWDTVAQARSVALMLIASGFGVFSAADSQRRNRLETLLALLLFVPLSWPLEAAAYAASYPLTPVWWTLFQPLLDVGTYFGVGLLLGLGTRRVAILWTFLPPLLLAGLIGLSVWLRQPLLNPLATARHVSWTHLSATALLFTLTFVFCVRSTIKGNHED